MGKYICLLFITLSFSAKGNDISAPFGFEWRQSYQQIGKKVKLTGCSTRKHLMVCETTKPIKKVSYGERYMVVIDNKYGLQKIILVSENINSDIMGIEGKALYNKVKHSLTTKYNIPQKDEYLEERDFKYQDEFYKCLKSENCGQWLSFWKAKDGSSALIELKGLSGGKGYLMLTYQSNKWEQIIKLVSKENKKSDHDAL